LHDMLSPSTLTVTPKLNEDKTLEISFDSCMGCLCDLQLEQDGCCCCGNELQWCDLVCNLRVFLSFSFCRYTCRNRHVSPLSLWRGIEAKWFVNRAGILTNI
jgi:hypothetical protein